MIKPYCVNNDNSKNPEENHEVHTVEHAEKLGISSYKYLGYCSSEEDALQEAKKIYSDADGCAICCPSIHKG